MRRLGPAVIVAAALFAAAPAPPLLAADPPADPNAPPALPVAMGQISGTVLTPQRQPVRGASVGVIREGGLEVYGTSTDGDGRYALKGLRSGLYAVLVMDPSGSILRKERVNARPLFRNIVDFQTAPAGTPPPHIPVLAPPEGAEAPAAFDLKGDLATADGQPIPEAWVTLLPLGGESPLLRARSDAAGSFRLLKIGFGYYRITARSLGHVTWSLGPLLLNQPGEISVRLSMVPFVLGQPQSPEDLLVPVDPIPPEDFEKVPPPSR